MRYGVGARPEHVREYWALFVNRRAHTIQARRPAPETGRHGYFVAKEFLPGQPPGPPQGPPKPLDDGTIRAHLEGRLTIGLYAMNPETQRCKWLAIDADYDRALYDLCALQYELTQKGIDVAVEQSRRGGHLWIFLAEPCLALECRLFVSHIAQQLKVPIKGKRNEEGATQVDGIEIFPKHDALEPGQFGNGLRGPLGVHQATGLRYYFYGADDFTLDAQIAYLNQRRKLTEAELRAFVDKLPPPEPKPTLLLPAPFNRNSRFDDRPQFYILDHVQVDTRRIVSGNYQAQCPSCQQQGRDKHGDNLHIKVSDPRFYVCRAGCDKYAIRAALGSPVPLATSGGAR
jgi:hypothetical protein